MLIRKAEPKDIPRIHQLLDQVGLIHHNGRPDLFKDNARKYTDDQLIQLMQNDERPIFVAADDEDFVLGYVFCMFEQHTDSSVLTDVRTLYIDDLCIDETLRGQRIGRNLYDFAVDFAKKSGCYNLTLNVWSCNASAMKFYQSCGLQPQKVHMETLLRDKA